MLPSCALASCVLLLCLAAVCAVPSKVTKGVDDTKAVPKAVPKAVEPRKAHRPADWDTYNKHDEANKKRNKNNPRMIHKHGVIEPRIQALDMSKFSGIPEGFQTYRVYIECDPTYTHNIHALFGDKIQPLRIATDDGSDFYHLEAPFGVDIGGVPEALVKVKPEAALDSWLTINVNEGVNREKISTMGVTFNTGGVLAEGVNSILFLMDPTEDLSTIEGRDIPKPRRPEDVVVLIAQLTVKTGSTFTGHVNVQGSYIGEKIIEHPPTETEDGGRIMNPVDKKMSWQEHAVCFSSGAGCKTHVLAKAEL